MDNDNKELKQKEIKQQNISETDEKGVTRWYNSEHELHRGDDLPAVESHDKKHQEWWYNGQKHRTTGPAVIDIIDDNGQEKVIKEWWFYNQKLESEDYKCQNIDILDLTEIDGSNPGLIFIQMGEFYYCFTVEELQNYLYYLPPLYDNPNGYIMENENQGEYGERNDFPYVIQEDKYIDTLRKQYDKETWIYKLPYLEVFIQEDIFTLLDEGYYVLNIPVEPKKDVILFRSQGFASNVHDYKTKIYSIEGVKKTNIRPPFYFSIGYVIHLYNKIRGRDKYNDKFSQFYSKETTKLGWFSKYNIDSFFYHDCITTSCNPGSLEFLWTVKNIRSLYKLISYYFDNQDDYKSKELCKEFLSIPRQQIDSLYVYNQNDPFINVKNAYADILYIYAYFLPEKIIMHKKNWEENKHENSGVSYATSLLDNNKNEEAKEVFWQLWDKYKNYKYLLRYTQMIEKENPAEAVKYYKQIWEKTKDKIILPDYISALKRSDGDKELIKRLSELLLKPARSSQVYIHSSLLL